MIVDTIRIDATLNIWVLFTKIRGQWITKDAFVSQILGAWHPPSPIPRPIVHATQRVQEGRYNSTSTQNYYTEEKKKKKKRQRERDGMGRVTWITRFFLKSALVCWRLPEPISPLLGELDETDRGEPPPLCWFLECPAGRVEWRVCPLNGVYRGRGRHRRGGDRPFFPAGGQGLVCLVRYRVAHLAPCVESALGSLFVFVGTVLIVYIGDTGIYMVFKEC